MGVSYGDELHLSFGGNEKPMSAWMLGTRGANWLLLNQEGVLARDTDMQEAKRAFKALEGERVISARAERADRVLVIGLESGARFILLPSPGEGLDLWELFSPFGWWLAVGPQGAVDLVEGNTPQTELTRLRLNP